VEEKWRFGAESELNRKIYATYLQISNKVRTFDLDKLL